MNQRRPPPPRFHIEIDEKGREMFTKEGQPVMRIEGAEAWIEFENAQFQFGVTDGWVVLTDDGGVERGGRDEARFPIMIQVCSHTTRPGRNP